MQSVSTHLRLLGRQILSYTFQRYDQSLDYYRYWVVKFLLYVWLWFDSKSSQIWNFKIGCGSYFTNHLFIPSFIHSFTHYFLPLFISYRFITTWKSTILASTRCITQQNKQIVRFSTAKEPERSWFIIQWNWRNGRSVNSSLSYETQSW